MKTKILTLFALVLCLGGYAQMSIAIVGSGAGGWPNDPMTDLHQMATTDGEHWALSDLILSSGELKFRADNAWTINWGDTSFPNGIATQNGANIICLAGVYDVTFNSTTGAYAFSATGVAVPTVKLINSGQAIDMVTNDGNLFTASYVNLIAGNTQFSINGDLFGDSGFPHGTAANPNTSIPILPGVYTSVTFDVTTGDYHFTAAPVISLNGDAIGGWGDGYDVDMSTSDGIIYTYNQLTTTAGLLKFRTDHLWTLNYGGTTFPSGTGILDGPEIAIPAGTWNITFNRSNGNYNFSTNPTAATIALVGSGAGGWPGSETNPGPYDIHQMTTQDGVNFTLYNIVLTDGEVKFRGDNNWLNNWGDTNFPSGTAVQNGPNILTTAGSYTVNFNRITGEYSFTVPLRMSIVGSAVGGWPSGEVGEIDAHQLESTDGVTFRLDNITVTDGFAKFRQNNSWEVNWGGSSLTGPLVFNGPEIPVSAGSYSVSVHRVSGSYQLGPAMGTTSFAKTNIKAYPNPTNNNWNFTAVKGSNIQSIQIVDMLGETIVNVTPAATHATVDASALNAGIYFAKITTATATETIKVVRN